MHVNAGGSHHHIVSGMLLGFPCKPTKTIVKWCWRCVMVADWYFVKVNVSLLHIYGVLVLSNGAADSTIIIPQTLHEPSLFGQNVLPVMGS